MTKVFSRTDNKIQKPESPYDGDVDIKKRSFTPLRPNSRTSEQSRLKDELESLNRNDDLQSRTSNSSSKQRTSSFSRGTSLNSVTKISVRTKTKSPKKYLRKGTRIREMLLNQLNYEAQ